MSKKIVFGVIAGIGVAGGVTKLVVDSISRYRRSKKLCEAAEEISDLAIDALEEAEALLKKAQEIASIYGDEDDYSDEDDFEDYEENYEDEEFEEADSPCGCPYEERCCIYAERLEKEHAKEAARG